MYQFNVFIHLLLAAIWVGGLIYTAAVVIPFAVRQDPEEKQRILRGLARKFRNLAWGSMLLLIITGIGNLSLRPARVKIGQLFNGEAFDPTKVDPFLATWLPWKLAFIAVAILLMLYHDYSSIRAAKEHAGSPETAPGNRAGSIAAALATLASIAVLYFSVRLIRG